MELAIIFISFMLRPHLKLSIFFSSVSKKPRAYLDRLLNACIYSMRVFVPWVSLINSAVFIHIRPRGM